MTMNVPTMDIGNAKLGMMVAETFRRKTKMTRMTRATARSRVNCTSCTEARIEAERS